MHFEESGNRDYEIYRQLSDKVFHLLEEGKTLEEAVVSLYGFGLKRDWKKFTAEIEWAETSAGLKIQYDSI